MASCPMAFCPGFNKNSENSASRLLLSVVIYIA